MNNPTSNFDYLLGCLTDNRMEWSYRLQLFCSGVRDMLFDQPYPIIQPDVVKSN